MNTPESNWGTSPYQQAVAEGERNTWLRWIAVGCGALALIAIGIGGYLYMNRAVALPVSVAIEAQPLVPGTTSELIVRVTNASPTDTALATEISVTLPEKTTSAGLENETASSSIAVPTVSVGDIAPGGTATMRLVLTTELDPSSAVPVIAQVTYATARDAEKRFEATATQDLVVREPAVTLAIEAPGAVVRAAPFDISLRYRNNTDKPLSGARVTLVLPRGLTIASSSADFAGGTVALADVPAKQGGSLKLTLLPGASAPHEMPLRAEVTAGGTTLAERTASVTISSDALAVNILVNGKDDVAVSADQTLSYVIDVKNLSRVPLKDVVVKARLDSPLFVLASVQPEDGSLAASEPVVTWNGVGVIGLRSIEPGQSVSLRLGVRIAKNVGSVASVTAPVVVTVTSPTVPAGTVGTGVTATDTALARLAASVDFNVNAYWSDPLKQITNIGTQPPQVGKATQYAVRWTVSPKSAGIKDAVVTASLEPGVRFTGKIVGASVNALTYDANTGKVTWYPGVVAANATVSATFQIEVTPAANQKGRTMRLMTDTKFTALDAFAGRALDDEVPAFTTALTSGAGNQGGGVVQ